MNFPEILCFSAHSSQVSVVVLCGLGNSPHGRTCEEMVSSSNPYVVKANICVPRSLQCSQRNEFCHWLQWEVWALTGQADVSSAGNIFQLASAAASIFFLWCLLKLIFFFSLKLNQWDLCSVLYLEVSFPYFFLNKLALQASCIVRGFFYSI